MTIDHFSDFTKNKKPCGLTNTMIINPMSEFCQSIYIFTLFKKCLGFEWGKVCVKCYATLSGMGGTGFFDVTKVYRQTLARSPGCEGASNFLKMS